MAGKVRGVICALIGASLWGFSGACSQYLFSHYAISPLFLTMARMLGAGLLFLATLIISQRDKLHDILMDRPTCKQLAAFGGLGLFLCQLTYLVVIGYTNAGTATVLQSLNMVFVVIATCLLMHRLPFAREVGGLACALVATFLIATKGDPGMLHIPLAGLIWGLANALSVAFYVMYPRRMFERWGSFPITGLGMLIGGVVAAIGWVFAAATGKGLDAGVPTIPHLDGIGLLVLVLIVVLGTFASFALYLEGVAVVGGVTGSLLGAVEPVSATLLSALWLGTVFTWADWLGLVLMIMTTILVTGRQTAYRRPRANPL